MIPQDDPLLKLLKEIGTDWQFTVIHLNPWKDAEIEALYKLGLVEIMGDVGKPYEHRFALTDSGRAWLDAAENDRRFRVLEGRHLEPVRNPETQEMLGYYISPDQTDDNHDLRNAADAAIRAGWE